jgi:predicted dehydrogenase
MPVRTFDDYDDALRDGPPDLVYVSTVNSEHGWWTARALEKGSHVVVDKPAFSGLDEARGLVDLAKRRRACLAEATVFAYHPQVRLIDEAYTRIGCRPMHLTSQFSFPPLPAKNFRYSKTLGGGALWDLGPYAVASARMFFRSQPQELICRVTERATEVDTAFTLLAVYEGGRSLVGHFGFRTAYINRLELLGPQLRVTADRIFTTPPDLANVIQVWQNDQPIALATQPADSFALFLGEVIEAIDAGRHEPFAHDLLMDAMGLDLLRLAAGV